MKALVRATLSEIKFGVEFLELAKLTYKHTPEVQIELLFSLQPTVFSPLTIGVH